MRQDIEELRLIKLKLFRNLPASILMYNSVGLLLSEDGIQRSVVSSNLQRKTFAIILLDMAESPKVVISMYCTPGAEYILKEILEQNVDWKEEIEFAVSAESYTDTGPC